MGGIFNYDGPIWGSLGKLADLVVLNFLTILFCIPLVTAGASLTAAHYVALKIRRGEGYVFRNFWKSFKENFKQSTIMWLIYVVLVAASVYSYLFMISNVGGTAGSLACAALFVGGIFISMTSVWVFPMQSKFINTIPTTIKNAFFMAFKYLFRTLLMLVINLLPIVLALVLSFQWWCLLLLFGFSVPIYLCAMLYDKKFEEIEEMILERQAAENADEVGAIEEGLN